MNESIYCLIPETYVEPERPPRHVSKFKSDSVKLQPPSYTTFPTGPAVDGSAAGQFRRSAANMGKVAEVDPRRFLKRGEGVKHAVPPQHHEKTVQKPPVVVLEDKPVMGLKSEKNFVKSNAVEAVNMAPRGLKPEPETYMQKKWFGKEPAYLSSVKAQLNAERQYVASLRESESKRQQEAKEELVHQMPEEQRLTLLTQLRARHEEKQRQFLSVPFARDTMMQIARKEKIEAELKEIEDAIAKLEKKVVYVYASDPYYGGWAKATAQKEAQEAAKRVAAA